MVLTVPLLLINLLLSANAAYEQLLGNKTYIVWLMWLNHPDVLAGSVAYFEDDIFDGFENV